MIPCKCTILVIFGLYSNNRLFKPKIWLKIIFTKRFISCFCVQRSLIGCSCVRELSHQFFVTLKWFLQWNCASIHIWSDHSRPKQSLVSPSYTKGTTYQTSARTSFAFCALWDKVFYPPEDGLIGGLFGPDISNWRLYKIRFCDIVTF